MKRYIDVFLIKSIPNKILSLFWSSIIIGFFLLPFGINPSTPFFILSMFFGIYYILRYEKVLTPRFYNIALICYPIMFIIMSLSLFYSYDKVFGMKLLERSIPLFIFPLLFMYIKESSLVRKKISNALLIGILITFLVNLLRALYNSLDIKGGVLVFNTSIVGNHSFYESFSHGGNHFIGGEFSYLLHPSYLSLYILIVLILFFSSIAAIKKNKLIFIILIVYLFLLASRASLVILFFLFLINLIVKWKGVTLINKIILSFSMLFLLVLNPRIGNSFERLYRFSELENYNYTTSEQSRILIILTSLDLISKAPVFGYGIGDADYELFIKYVESNYLTNIEFKYNAHNQFLQTSLQIGIVGLFFLIFPFFLIYIYSQGDITKLSILLVLILTLLFESMLVRYNGIIFFAIIIPFLSRFKHVKNSNE
ncbi:O-antigen ligase family protein [Galbibacter orientalis]|uniref:O-antigen ligase family protein n=1 Tax=Galbibacter orientalis TaxID=453852 RepID=UPI003080D51F